jgi:ribosomal protein L7Ae-like RNA K-turn-binding protein
LNSKFLSNLGLARRAGKLLRGRDEVFTALHEGKAFGLYAASDLSPRSIRLIEDQANSLGITPTPVGYSMSQLGDATGLKPFGIFSVSDKNFRKMLDTALENKEAVQ